MVYSLMPVRVHGMPGFPANTAHLWEKRMLPLVSFLLQDRLSSNCTETQYRIARPDQNRKLFH